MAHQNNVSRKYFLQTCSATLGLMAIGIPKALALTPETEKPFYSHSSDKNERFSSTRIRGSWVQIGAPQEGDISLIGCQILVEENENTAVQQAAKFLASDIYQLSGYQPTIIHKRQEEKTTIILTTWGNMDIPPALISPGLKGKREAYQIFTEKNIVWLVGADFRGTAYSVYTLSERLGIDPLYLWTGYRPVQNKQLILKKTTHFENSPTVKYRGFFHDDEDVLPRPFDRYGYPLRIGDVPLEWYQRFFETALRLKMNMVAPYVRVHRRYEVQKCASDWGLYFTSHHYDILLSNPFGIERFFLADRRGVSTEWDWFKNKENMVKYWRGGVEENKHINSIWPVGLRGTDDHAYEFPKDTPEKEQAKVFREAIDAQVKAVKEISISSEAPIFHFTLYTEMLEKYKKHPEDFNVPDDVILVWPDNNDGVMRDLPTGASKWKHGVYYHLAYFGGAPTKQSAHVITPNRIAEQFKQIVDADATEFILVNVSELREHVMEARMIADICWNAPAVLHQTNPAHQYLKWWCNEYFGNPNLDLIIRSYQDYYNLINSSEKTYFGATQFELILETLHHRFTKKPIHTPDPVKVKILKERDDQYTLAFKNIDQLKSSFNLMQKQFFFEHVEFGLRIDQRPTQAALILLKAIAEPNDNKAWDLIAKAIVPLEQLELEILRAERPPFDKWHQPTWIKTTFSPFNLHRSYTQLRAFIVNNGLISPINPRVSIGHNIEGARLWTTYLEQSNQIKATY